ncbi:magnesium-transporting ATPase (P-type) [Pseudomonas sp. TE3786]
MENLYKTPEAALTEQPVSEHGQAFFVTSIGKLCVMYLLTMGMYMLYWMYRHWDSQRAEIAKPIWPIARSVLMTFYTHSLCALISKRLQAQQQPAWRYSGAANWFVLFSVISLLVFVFTTSESPLLLSVALPLFLLAASLQPMVAIQRQANLASLDPQGKSNSTYSGANIGWILVGALFWALTALGTVIIALGLDK